VNEQLDRAHDAQLDWALDEVAGAQRPPDLLAAVQARLDADGDWAPAGDRPPRPAQRPWLAAAGVLLGVGVVVAVWCGRGQTPSSAPARTAQGQDPQQKEPAEFAVASTLEELAKVPDDSTAVRLSPVDAATVAALRRLQRLTHLDLGLARATGDPAPLDEDMLREVSKLTTLRELRLDYRAGIESTWLQPLADLPLLETLTLKFVPVDDAVARTLANLPSLRKLDLAFTAIGDEGLAVLVAMPGLRELSLRACGRLTTAGLTALGKATRLEVLDLSCAVGLSSGAPRALAGNATLAILKRSESMMLAEMALAGKTGGVTDEVLQTLKPLANLRELRLFGCSAVTAEGLAAVPSARLRTLDLTVRGDFAPFAAALPPGLEVLGLGWSTTLKDADLTAIAERLPHLQRVDLTRCTGIGDAGLEKLLQGCPIRELSLDLCTGLTAESLPTLLGCKTLRKLDVSGLRWVDGSVQQQLKSMPGMELEARVQNPFLR
jgi:hypothetical protein